MLTFDEIVEDYKLRVVVDGSPNSLDETLLRTKRQRLFDIKPMTKQMVWKMGQFQELFKYIKKADLDDVVFAVLGGIPADYEELWEMTKSDLQKGQNPRQIIGAYLCGQIFTAIRIVRGSCGNDDTATEELIKLFQETRFFSESSLVAKKVQRPSPDKVFRAVKQNGVSILIPASNAIGIVLKHGLSKEPSLNELENLVKNEPKS